MNERVLRLEDFQGLVGTGFTVVADGIVLPELTLVEATALSTYGAEVSRPPFSLVFEMPGEQRLNQGLVSLRNESLGEAEIFLVPMAKTAGGIRYAATFG